MKLADGVTVYAGGRKFKGEMPDNMLPKDPDDKKLFVDKQAKKIKAQAKKKADAVKSVATEEKGA